MKFLRNGELARVLYIDHLLEQTGTILICGSFAAILVLSFGLWWLWSAIFAFFGVVNILGEWRHNHKPELDQQEGPMSFGRWVFAVLGFMFFGWLAYDAWWPEHQGRVLQSEVGIGLFLVWCVLSDLRNRMAYTARSLGYAVQNLNA